MGGKQPNFGGLFAKKKEAIPHVKASPEEGWAEDQNPGRNKKEVQGASSDLEQKNREAKNGQQKHNFPITPGRIPFEILAICLLCLSLFLVFWRDS